MDFKAPVNCHRVRALQIVLIFNTVIGYYGGSPVNGHLVTWPMSALQPISHYRGTFNITGTTPLHLLQFDILIKLSSRLTSSEFLSNYIFRFIDMIDSVVLTKESNESQKNSQAHGFNIFFRVQLTGENDKPPHMWSGKFHGFQVIISWCKGNIVSRPHMHKMCMYLISTHCEIWWARCGKSYVIIKISILRY